jgi:hypothetical protein
VEVAVTIVLLGVLVGIVVTVFNRTIDSVLEGRLRSAAAAVGQRQLEKIMATMTEPNSHQLHGQDEIDGRFQWTLKLTREPVAGMEGQSRRVETSVIRAQVSVDTEVRKPGAGPVLEMERYFAMLDPLEGKAVAVPFEQQEQPGQAQRDWEQELREELGREPTLDELLRKMLEKGEISPDMFEQLHGQGGEPQ